ncbi:MAG TPA: hypothetical protein VLI06_19875 [Solimonas sp.]|nr:hypothetical protein [Solimonas sp.]
MKATSLAALALALSLSLQAQAADEVRTDELSLDYGRVTARYAGTDGNWFNPANWSSGRVPGAEDVVLLGGDVRVVIDPSQDSRRIPGKINLHALWVVDSAQLETRPGTHLVIEDEAIRGRGRITYRSSAVEGGSLSVSQGPVVCVACSGLKLNPTSQSKRIIVLKSSVSASFGLGGRTPASTTTSSTGETLTLNGPGTYATLTSETVSLPTPAPAPASGLNISARIDRLPKSLVVDLHYGFTPVAGDSFQIITATQSLEGEFPEFPEGALVGCTDDNIGLHISYRGGDGNDVVLDARRKSPLVCTLARIGELKIRGVAILQ